MLNFSLADYYLRIILILHLPLKYINNLPYILRLNSTLWNQ